MERIRMERTNEIEWNGTDRNELEWIGMAWDGMGWNGTKRNEIEWNWNGIGTE